MSQSPTEIQRLIEEAVAEKDREISELRSIDVPKWVLDLSEDLPACQITEAGVRMDQSIFLPWVSEALRRTANERDSLRSHLYAVTAEKNRLRVACDAVVEDRAALQEIVNRLKKELAESYKQP